jgi:C1A family cysteine protease
MALETNVAELKTALASSAARWTADVTHLTYLSESEKRLRLGAAPPGGIQSLQEREAAASKMHVAGAASAAPQVAHAWDWRNVAGRNFITPIRDQSSCGSCVAFGSIAAMEGMGRIEQNAPNLEVDLSEADLFYCDAAQDNCNCNTGWWPSQAVKYLANPGVCDEGCFPYTPGNQPCHRCADWQSRVARITSSQSITDVTAMKTWVSTRGPLITCFTVYNDFYSYRSGVYHHVSGNAVGGHCVCVVGYDDTAQCWICKNSWGPSWGESGFFRIGYGQCGIDADMWSVQGVVFTKAVLSDLSRVTPGLAVLGHSLVLAWTGTDSHLNAMTSSDGFHFGGKVILGELSFDGPAVASSGSRLFLAWSGTDAAHHLNVLSSSDARNFGGKVTLGDTAASGPALAFMNDRLFLAWVGTDSHHSLNIMSSTDGTHWSGKVTLGESSDSQIGLCAANGTLYLIWQGTDSNSSLNILQSTDGHTWTNKITLHDSSDHTPAGVQGRELVLAWTGRDSNHSLNRMVSTTGSGGFGSKITFSDTATAGVALAQFDTKVFIAWGGTDSDHHLNVMPIPT